MNNIKFLCLFLFLWGILEGSIHDKNREIFSQVIESHLQKGRDALMLDLNAPLSEALEKGLDLSAYTYRVHSQTGELCYTTALLWEGGERANIIFLLYIWPSKEEALKHAPHGKYYETSIHSHPIPCAFTVLDGEMTQYRFEPIKNHPGKSVRPIERKVFQVGEGEVDLMNDSFIHQMVLENTKMSQAITLHAYGCSSLEEFRRIMDETHAEHTYFCPSG